MTIENRDLPVGTKEQRKVASSCLMCHEFHRPENGPFDAATHANAAALSGK